MSLFLPIKVYSQEESSSLNLTEGLWRLTFNWATWLPTINIKKPFSLSIGEKTYTIKSVATNHEGIAVVRVIKESNFVAVGLILGTILAGIGLSGLFLVIRKVEKVVELSPNLLMPIAGIGVLIYLVKK